MSAGRDGSDQVWGFISTLVAGPAVWGAIGHGLDRLAGTALFLPLGVVVGFVTSLYLVYVLQGRDTALQRTPRELATGPDPGDDGQR